MKEELIRGRSGSFVNLKGEDAGEDRNQFLELLMVNLNFSFVELKDFDWVCQLIQTRHRTFVFLCKDFVHNFVVEVENGKLPRAEVGYETQHTRKVVLNAD
jgi:hypothetical protein